MVVTVTPSAPKLTLTADISVIPPGVAANRAVTTSKEVRDAATRAEMIAVEITKVASSEAGNRACAPERSEYLDILRPTIMPSMICRSPLVQVGTEGCGSPRRPTRSVLPAPAPSRAPMRTPAGMGSRLPKKAPVDPKTRTTMKLTATLMRVSPSTQET